MNYNTIFFLIFQLISFTKVAKNNYTPDWPSLDKHPLPSWFDNAKIGIRITWGVFSVPSYKTEWFWQDWKGQNPDTDIINFMNENYPSDFTYADFGNQFKAEFFDPNKWANLLQNSGAKYVVVTSKHHEGYCLWPSEKSWNWNSMDIGPKRDLIGEISNAIRSKTDLKFGLYHSLYEWFNPLYLSDKASLFHQNDFVKSKTIPELYDIVNRYKPDLIWSDGEWEANSSYWNSTEFISWLYNDSPVKETILVNDRWGADITFKHGDFFTTNNDNNPKTILTHKWEHCISLDLKSSGYRRNFELTDILSIQAIIGKMVETVSRGGNILINVGVTKEGTIAPIFEERLVQLGNWLTINGEAIYSTKPWKVSNDTTNPNVWYTTNDNSDVYAILLKYPKNDRKLTIGSPTLTESTSIKLLGYNVSLQWIGPPEGGIIIDLSSIDSSKISYNWVWVFKLTDVV